MDKSKTYNYSWSDYEASISWSRIFKSWRWSVNSVSTDYTDFHNHMDVDLDTLEIAEDDMFNDIETHIGSTPERQIVTS